MSKKKLLFIINNKHFTINKYLDNYEVVYIKSFDIINYSIDELTNLISFFDIILIGGGAQHLIKEEIYKYPEFKNLFNIVKICDNLSKLLVGICLGCQIIAYIYECEIHKLNNLCIGTGFLNLKSINFKEDKFLSNIDYNIIKYSFSFHYDYIIISKNNKLIEIIAKSNDNIPYIIKHCSKKIYGFQFHPELSLENISNSIKKFNVNYYLENYNNNICINFFDALFNFNK